MTVGKESRDFFSRLSKVWQNFKDYKYLEGINLSPEQIDIIEQDSDQLLIEGYAGTGKSLTLLYKLINVLVQQEDKRVLYVTFNKTLIDDTKKRLNESKEYNDNENRHYIKIATFHEIASEVLKENRVIESGISKLTVDVVKRYRGDSYRRIAGILSKYQEVNKSEYKELKKEERLYKTHDPNFVVDEINWIKAMGFIQKEKYMEIERTGRSKSIRLTRAQRNTIFKIFEDYQRELISKYNNYLDLEDYALKIIENEFLIDENKKFDYIFVDEVQDLDPMQIYALCLLTRKSIVLSGDAKQRIYKKSPIKYEDIGLNIKGNGKRKILNKNYRSTAEIVKLANDLVFFDNEEKLVERHFVREGEKPIIHFSDNKKSIEYISKIIKKIHEEDDSKTIAIIHREDIKAKVNMGKSNFRLELESKLLSSSFSDINTYGKKFDYKQKKQIFYTNAYDIKGLEFDTVFIVDFNRRFYPNSDEIKKIQSDNEGKDQNLVNEDIADFINREKKLLYVAMTRAKDNMYLIANTKNEERGISNFIFDFDPHHYIADNFTKKRIEELGINNRIQLKELLGEKYTKIYEPEKYEEENRKLKEKAIRKKDKLLEVQDDKCTEVYEAERYEEKSYRYKEEEVIRKEQLILESENKPLINQKKVEFMNNDIRQQIRFKDTDFKEDEIRDSKSNDKEANSVEKYET